MSLDFFASEHQSLISKDTPCYCMDEKIHKEIFSSLKANESYKIISRFKDYYHDCIILFNQLDTLLIELKDVNVHNNLAHEQIINFIDFINSAKKDRHNIYAYSD